VNSPLKSFRRRATAAVLLFLVGPFAMTGCSDDEIRNLGGGPVAANFQASAVPASITVVGGAGQIALTGASLATPITVTVADRLGAGIPGIPVAFQVTSGRATLSVETGVTDRNGQVSTGLNLISPGGITGSAKVVGFPDVREATFAVTAVEPAQPFIGAGTAAATNALNALRAAIGGVNNGGAPPAQTSGRREINWDAVALDGTGFAGTQVIVAGDSVAIPTTRFQARGAVFDRLTAVADDLTSVNPGIAGQFPPFSNPLVFAPFGANNQVRVDFVRATAAPAVAPAARVSAFGAIFLDVESTNTSFLEFFNGANSLGRFAVPPGPSGNPEFVGGLFTAGPVVTHVVLTTGQGVLFNFANGVITSGAADVTVTGAVDQVALDDFIYSEPQ
jgi:hypothetical protein